MRREYSIPLVFTLGTKIEIRRVRRSPLFCDRRNLFLSLKSMPMRNFIFILWDQLNTDSAALDDFDPSLGSIWMAEVAHENTRPCLKSLSSHSEASR